MPRRKSSSILTTDVVEEPTYPEYNFQEPENGFGSCGGNATGNDAEKAQDDSKEKVD